MDTLQNKFGTDEDGFRRFPSYSYDELVTSQGAVIVLDESDDDYQGDTYYLLKDGERYGYLVVGWGSCSGCDALEYAADKNFAAVQQLRDEILSDVLWGTKEEILAHVESRSEGNDWYVREQTWQKFKAQTLELLRNRT